MKTLSLLLLIALVIFSGCLPNDLVEKNTEVGFFHGIWHGWICWISLIVGLFTDVRIYAMNNSGWWYDLGWMLGSGLFMSKFGFGIHFSRKGISLKRKETDEN